MANMEKYDLVVIGGGPAGLAAACEAKKNGIDKVLSQQGAAWTAKPEAMRPTPLPWRW